MRRSPLRAPCLRASCGSACATLISCSRCDLGGALGFLLHLLLHARCSFRTTVFVTVSRPEAPKMSSARISDSGVCVSSVMVTDSSVKPLRPRSSRSAFETSCAKCSRLRCSARKSFCAATARMAPTSFGSSSCCALAANRVASTRALVDADGARRLLDVVLVGLDADVELGRQVRRDEVLGDERVVPRATNGQADRRQRQRSRPMKDGHNPACAPDEDVRRRRGRSG